MASKKLSEDEKQSVSREFRGKVNLAPARLEKWLETDESLSVGWSRSGGESIGHQSGRKIIAIRRKKKADLTEADYVHMRKVVGYIDRHLAQRPGGDVRETRWRFSLMNWGHDPLKKAIR